MYPHNWAEADRVNTGWALLLMKTTEVRLVGIRSTTSVYTVHTGTSLQQCEILTHTTSGDEKRLSRNV
eukprot:m.325378 g.325378  ORF g.325378 m.325378 type:complete len:68 (-) comp20384_c0_seq4:2169-2372(-)